MPACECLDKTLALLEFEIHLLLLSLRYPDSFRAAAQPESELFWSEEYSKTDLMELVAALHTLKVLRTRDGKPATMTMITAALCCCFHTSLNRVNRKKWDVVNRKICVTRFLDALREAIIGLSQR